MASGNSSWSFPGSALLLCTCGFLTGVWYGIYGTALPHLSTAFLFWYTIVFTLFTAFILFGLFRFEKLRKTTKHFPSGQRLAVFSVLIFFFLGIFRVIIYDRMQSHALKALAGETVTISGVVTDRPFPSSTGKAKGFPVQALLLHTPEGDQAISGKLLVYAKNQQSAGLSRGDSITFTARLTPPSHEIYPGSFSARSYLYRQGLCFSVFAMKLASADPPVRCSSPSYWLQGIGLRLQDSLLHSIERTFGEKSAESALLKGILLGYREDFSQEQYRQLADSGFIHITAVSGMHIMFLAGLLNLLFRRLRVPKLLQLLLLFPILLFFTAAAAFTPSICRAALMLAFMELAYLVQREPSSLHALASSALLLLISNPYTLTSYSFLLSFSATLGILLFSMPLEMLLQKLFPRKNGRSLSRRTALLHRGRNAVLTSLSVGLGSNLGIGYFMARFFHRFNWGSILGNIPVLFLSGFAFTGGILNWILSLISPPMAILLAKYFLRPILWLLNALAAFFSHPFFRFEIPTPPRSAFLFYLLLCGALYHWINAVSSSHSANQGNPSSDGS